MMGYDYVWGWVGMLLMLLFWFGLVAVIIWAMTSWRSDRTLTAIDGPRDDHALAILRERYAHGEMTDEEFDQRRTILSDTGR